MRVVIVHTLEHASAALEVATALSQKIVLQSAPDAIFYAGALYILEMFKQAQQQYPHAETCCIIDCADSGAEAINAMQAGHTHLRSSVAGALKSKLRDIAQQHGAVIIDAPYEALDLQQAKNTKVAIEQWLKEAS